MNRIINMAVENNSLGTNKKETPESVPNLLVFKFKPCFGLFQAAPSASDVLALRVGRRAVEDLIGGAIVWHEHVDSALLRVPTLGQDVGVIHRAARHLGFLHTSR